MSPEELKQVCEKVFDSGFKGVQGFCINNNCGCALGALFKYKYPNSKKNIVLTDDAVRVILTDKNNTFSYNDLQALIAGFDAEPFSKQITESDFYKIGCELRDKYVHH